MVDPDRVEARLPTRPRRQIRRWGSLARLVVGAGLLVGAVRAGADDLDVVLGLLLFPSVEVGVLLLRGRRAASLRLYGRSGLWMNLGIAIAGFSIVPEAAAIFYGVSILLAFVRGDAGCELFTISNWLRRRDDQIVCPVFSPIDRAEARRSETEPRR